MSINWTFDASKYVPGESSGFELVPEGTYKAKIIEVQQPFSKQSGDPQLVISMRCSGVNGRVREYFTFPRNPNDYRNDWVRRRFGDMCTCFNVDPVQVLQEPKLLIDKIGNIKVVHKKNDTNGRVYANIQEYILTKPQAPVNPQPADLNTPANVFGNPSEPIIF